MQPKFKNIVSYVLAILMLLAFLNSGHFFLGMLKLSIGKWLAFNACSLAILFFLICFVLYLIRKKEVLLAIPLLPMYYYGTMGLFVMPWNSANAFAQITHVVVTLSLLWVLFLLLKERKYDSLGKGLLIGMVVFVPLFAYLQHFNQLHMEEFLKALQSM